MSVSVGGQAVKGLLSIETNTTAFTADSLKHSHVIESENHGFEIIQAEIQLSGKFVKASVDLGNGLQSTAQFIGNASTSSGLGDQDGVIGMLNDKTGETLSLLQSLMADNETRETSFCISLNMGGGGTVFIGSDPGSFDGDFEPIRPSQNIVDRFSADASVTIGKSTVGPYPFAISTNTLGVVLPPQAVSALDSASVETNTFISVSNNEMNNVIINMSGTELVIPASTYIFTEEQLDKFDLTAPGTGRSLTIFQNGTDNNYGIGRALFEIFLVCLDSNTLTVNVQPQDSD